MTNTSALLARLASQIHITVSPPLNSLGESRQVLAALQKFGEVVTFCNCGYDITNRKPDRAIPILAIFESSDAAQRALEASPLPVTLSPPAHATPSSSSSSAAAANSVPSTARSREVFCFMQSSRHNHAGYLKRNPFHSTWNVDKESPIYKDMMSPETAVPLRELADVLQRPKPTISRRAKEKIREGNLRMGAESLIELWREGLDNAEMERKERMEGEREGEREKSAKTGLRRVSLKMLSRGECT